MIEIETMRETIAIMLLCTLPITIMIAFWSISLMILLGRKKEGLLRQIKNTGNSTKEIREDRDSR